MVKLLEIELSQTEIACRLVNYDLFLMTDFSYAALCCFSYSKPDLKDQMGHAQKLLS